MASQPQREDLEPRLDGQVGGRLAAGVGEQGLRVQVRRAVLKPLADGPVPTIGRLVERVVALPVGVVDIEALRQTTVRDDARPTRGTRIITTRSGSTR